MLKKKALTAVLTAALVFGIGGMATESVNTYEHGQSDTCIHGLFEPGLAHAASIQITNNAPSTQSAPLPTSSWRCYFCGSFTNHGSQYVKDSNGVWRSREPNPHNSGTCSHAGDVTRCLGGLRKDSGNHPGITAVVQTTVGLMHGRKPVLSGQGNFTGDLLYQMSYY